MFLTKGGVKTDSQRMAGFSLLHAFNPKYGFNFELESMFLYHWGDYLEREEIVGSINLRYTIPWKDHVKVSIAVCEGLSYATKKMDTNNNNEGNELLNYLSFETTLGIPPLSKKVDAVFRIHHRSGNQSIGHLGTGDTNFYTFGIRYKF